MKSARVFLVDDDPEARGIMLRVLELEGHSVPLVATSLEEAEEAVGLVEKQKIDVAVLDASLSLGSLDDGRTIAAILRQKNLSGLTIIGWSSDRRTDYGDVNPPRKELAKIGRIINGL